MGALVPPRSRLTRSAPLGGAVTFVAPKRSAAARAVSLPAPPAEDARHVLVLGTATAAYCALPPPLPLPLPPVTRATSAPSEEPETRKNTKSPNKPAKTTDTDTAAATTAVDTPAPATTGVSVGEDVTEARRMGVDV